MFYQDFYQLKRHYWLLVLVLYQLFYQQCFFGPKYSTIIALLGDLIGALLFPFGAYFPGYTLSQAIIGLIYGIFLYENENKKITDSKFLIRLIISSILSLIGVGIFITGIWVHITAGKAYVAVLSARVVTQLIMIPIQVVVMFGLRKLLKPAFEKFLY